MVWLKQLLAIPLAATVIWLGWVLAQQSGVDAFARLLFVLLLIAAGVWCVQQRLLPRGVSRVLAVVVVLVAGWLAWPLFDDAVPAADATRAAIGDWQPWSRDRLDELVTEGRPVFVDFTAAWCVSCQANKKLVLEREEAIANFADKKVVLLRADWTRRDPEITAALAEFGRRGVPVYVLYRPGKSTLVLSEILTPRWTARGVADAVIFPLPRGEGPRVRRAALPQSLPTEPVQVRCAIPSPSGRGLG